ncbi:hypothetical protein DEA98_29065 (plasmid) [Brucella pseudogrignonensis]|jgi:hypothetical protein|uniref:Uncharacterized protein n=3 Tax=Brucella TaxID=234 RepID=A0A7Y3X041_9HYPH|nr:MULTISPECIES: hypothetical protein [Brucella/Ochrobactrum group]KAB0565891.1 hypothetical protein F7Q93_22800 [Brucella pituitosa]KAB2790819.1 hypothetical protein F9L06_23965 [Brucella anthropi]MCM0753565.1 hypothetical protein [Brucella pseudogrignonensis]NNV23909.1 hypothetical protein [Brucella pseudogrignonensis]
MLESVLGYGIIRRNKIGWNSAMLPRYLRPVFDREAYGPISKTEKAVRFAVFVPLSVLCMVPGVVFMGLFLFTMGLGTGRILLDDTGTMTSLKIVMFVVAPALFLVGLAIRKYCLPFD